MSSLAITAPAQEPGQNAPGWSVGHWLVTDNLSEPGELPTAPRAGRITLVDFWATWCLPCVAGMEELSALQQRERERGLDVVAISDEPLPTVIAFLRRASPDGQPWWSRFRTALATDPDGSSLAELVPAEFRQVRPFAVLIGRSGAIEWMGPSKEAAPVVTALQENRWDRAAFAARWQRQLAEQRERDRIHDSEDWAAVKRDHWNDVGMLGKCAFRIAFDFGSQLKNRDLAMGAAFAERAVELSGSASAYELLVLAQIRHVQGQHDKAASLAREAITHLKPDDDASFYRDNLRRYEAAAAKK
ncbi:MAG: TlpA family protein disulfide reductase [Planctomycetes bacterium]|nr:TlpA family protein disulfide reductase [Planctomycetota bacterium]